MTTQVIEYNVTEAAIAELTKEKETLLSASELDYKAIDNARKRNGKIRRAIEKRRKEYKADALEYGRKVDSKAKESSEPVTAIEDAYKDVLNKHEAELEAVRAAAEQEEQARIAVIKERIEDINSYLSRAAFCNAEEISDLLCRLKSRIGESFNYQEFTAEGLLAEKGAIQLLQERLEEAIEYEERQQKEAAQRKKDNEARIALQAEKDAFEQEQKDAQAKIDFERASIQKEKDDLQLAKVEAEKAEVEREEKQAEVDAKIEIARIETIEDRIEEILCFKNRIICLYSAEDQGLSIAEFNRLVAEKFDFMEFENEALSAIKETSKYLKDKFDSLTKFEAKKAAAKKAEDERLKQVAKEEAERKTEQAAEDRIRNAAPELLEALEGIIAITDRKHVAWDKAHVAIKLAKGE